jgi:hypothetical protein
MVAAKAADRVSVTGRHFRVSGMSQSYSIERDEHGGYYVKSKSAGGDDVVSRSFATEAEAQDALERRARQDRLSEQRDGRPHR